MSEITKNINYDKNFSKDQDILSDVQLMIRSHCRIEFDISDESIEASEFGFDLYNSSVLGLETGDFKNEYHRYEDINGEEYLVPWVSISKGQTIKLNLKITMSSSCEDININLSNPKFTFSPTEITKDTNLLSITCNHILRKETLLEFKTDNGIVVGAIKFSKNKIEK